MAESKSRAELYEKLHLGLEVLDAMYLWRSNEQVRQIVQLERVCRTKLDEIRKCTQAYDKHLQAEERVVVELFNEVMENHAAWREYYFQLMDEQDTSLQINTENVDDHLYTCSSHCLERMEQQERCLKACIALKIRVEDIMDAIHFSVVPVSPEEVDKDECCLICHGPFDASDPMLALSCNHVMHDCCIKEWIKVDPTCPMCRTFTLPAEMLTES